jgi:hypothetical protein
MCFAGDPSHTKGYAFAPTRLAHNSTSLHAWFSDPCSHRTHRNPLSSAPEYDKTRVLTTMERPRAHERFGALAEAPQRPAGPARTPVGPSPQGVEGEHVAPGTSVPRSAADPRCRAQPGPGLRRPAPLGHGHWFLRAPRPRPDFSLGSGAAHPAPLSNRGRARAAPRLAQGRFAQSSEAETSIFTCRLRLADGN